MLDLFLPRRCPYCNRTLMPQEEGLCLECLAILPRVHAELPDNEVEHRLLGRFPFEHATSFCYYVRQGSFGNIIRQAKFSDRPWVNAQVTRIFAEELQLAASQKGVAGWPYDIDVIVPVPLHLLRLLHRGYNQSAPIAETLSVFWKLPVENGCLRKRRHTSSQVGLTGDERLRNEEGSFVVRHPERLASKHVLLVDDVLTTGATIVAAADALLESVPGVRISVLTLALTNW